jgi:putative MATE family efflux protein
MIIGNVFQQLYNIVDSIIVGHFLGKEALAAVGASFPVIFVLISLVMGVSIGVNIVISQFFGARNFEKVLLSIDTMFIFIFVASIIITSAGIGFSNAVFTVLKLPEEVMPMAISYFNIYVAGMLMVFGFNEITAVLRGLGDSRTPLYLLIISTLLNIGLDLLFVLAFGWGVDGVAYATVISQGFTFIAAAWYLNRVHPLIHFKITTFRFDKEVFIQSLRIGLPTGLQQTFVALGMMALIRIVNDFGTDAIAAYTVATRIDSFASLPAMNFSAALSTFVGQNIGANRTDRVKAGYRATFLMSSTFSIIVTLAALFFGREMMGWFTPDKTVIEIGYSYLVIAGSFYIVFSSMFVTHGLLRGAGDTFVPMLFTLFSLWILRIPISYMLSRPSVGLNEIGIWWGIPIAWCFGFGASWIYYKTGRWKTKSVVKYPVKSNER